MKIFITMLFLLSGFSSVSAGEVFTPQLSHDDKATIALALIDFQESNEPIYSFEGLVLSDKSFKDWADYNGVRPNDFDIPIQNLVERLRKRNDESYSLKTLSISHEKIAQDDLSAMDVGPTRVFKRSFREKHGDKVFVKLSLPAYASDKQNCLIWFYFGPAAHGGSATYLLSKLENKWVIKQRRFVRYK